MNKQETILTIINKKENEIMNIEERIQMIAEDYTAYIKGSIKQFRKHLEREGIDIVTFKHYQNYNGWAVAVTEICYYDNDSDFCSTEINWG